MITEMYKFAASEDRIKWDIIKECVGKSRDECLAVDVENNLSLWVGFSPEQDVSEGYIVDDFGPFDDRNKVYVITSDIFQKTIYSPEVISELLEEAVYRLSDTSWRIQKYPSLVPWREKVVEILKENAERKD